MTGSKTTCDHILIEERESEGCQKCGAFAWPTETKATTPQECECCDISNDTVKEYCQLSPWPIPPEFLCDNCAENRWYRHQEKLMEET